MPEKEIARYILPNNEIFNCTIHHVGLRHQEGTPAVKIQGKDNHVEHCLIHDAPGAALELEGSGYLVQRNEIHHVCMDGQPRGAIVLGDRTGASGAILNKNYIHDLGSADGVHGIHLGCSAAIASVTENVFLRPGKGIVLESLSGHNINNNFFVKCFPAIQLVSCATNPVGACRIHHNINWNGQWTDIPGNSPAGLLELSDNQDFDHPAFFHISRVDLQPVGKTIPWINPIPFRHIGAYTIDGREHRYFPVEALWPKGD